MGRVVDGLSNRESSKQCIFLSDIGLHSFI